jgi:uncharacterized protein
MKTSIVFDTNALVSAALSKNAVSGQAFRKAVSTFSIVTSSACFDELVDVILRPKFREYLDIKDALDFIDNYKNIATFKLITHHVTDCRDPKDNKFLDVALAAFAQYIVTGDTDLLVLHPYHGIEIVKPAIFLAL